MPPRSGSPLPSWWPYPPSWSWPWVGRGSVGTFFGAGPTRNPVRGTTRRPRSAGPRADPASRQESPHGGGVPGKEHLPSDGGGDRPALRGELLPPRGVGRDLAHRVCERLG